MNMVIALLVGGTILAFALWGLWILDDAPAQEPEPATPNPKRFADLKLAAKQMKEELGREPTLEEIYSRADWLRDQRWFLREDV